MCVCEGERFESERYDKERVCVMERDVRVR